MEYWLGEVVNPHSKDDLKDNGHAKERNKMTNSLRYEVLRRDGFKCLTCGANGGESKLEVDHIIPVSKGGLTEPDNLQSLCFDCNRGKRDGVT